MGYNKLLLDTPESFEPEVPYQQSHEVALYQADGSREQHLGSKTARIHQW